MSFSKIFTILVSIAIFSSYPGFSQGGSNYSIYGIGDIIANSNAVFDALGSTSIALPIENSINVINPASWGFLTQTRIRGGYRFNQHLIKSGNSQLLQNNGKVDGLTYALSIDTAYGASIVFGFYPFSSVNYFISKRDIVYIDNLSLSIENQYQGSGGLSQAILGFSLKPFYSLYFGASLLVDFGTINSSIRTLVYGSNASSAITEKHDYFLGTGFRGGLIYKPYENLLFGMFFETHGQTRLVSEVQNIYELTLDTTFISEHKIQLPNAFGFGVSYRIGRYLVAADYSNRNFSVLEYNRGPKTSFHPENKFSLGFSILGKKSLFVPYTEQITYNFGSYFKHLYPAIEKNFIKEFAFSFGMEFPLVGSATLNSGVVLGGRIPKTSLLPNEYFGRLIFEITLGETWFVPFRRE
ncbi:MAG: hypothetical protein N2517_09220 [Ignavibacteria bacterium]|nr:hypothetical protein [Ignavibacteria bacterium]